MSNIINCPDCRKMFLKVYADKCPECVQREEAQFSIIREYMRECGGKAKMNEIVENTGVEEKYVMRMLRDKRLSSEFCIEYKCDSCNELITAGNRCKKCHDKMAASINKILQKNIEPQREIKTRVFDKRS